MVLAVPVPGSVGTGQVLTAAFWNAQVRDAITFLLNPPDFVGKQSTGQSIPSGTPTAVALDTNTLDSYAGHSTVTNNTRYVAQVSGTYSASGVVAYPLNSTSGRSAHLRVNGVDLANSQTQMHSSSTYNTIVPTPTLDVYLNAGDYIELIAQQSSGGSLTLLTAAPGNSGLTVRWVHT